MAARLRLAWWLRTPVQGSTRLATCWSQLKESGSDLTSQWAMLVDFTTGAGGLQDQRLPLPLTGEGRGEGGGWVNKGRLLSNCRATLPCASIPRAGARGTFAGFALPSPASGRGVLRVRRPGESLEAAHAEPLSRASR